MDSLTILHLSDLHFSPSKRKDINIVEEALFNDLDYLKGEGLQPDIVIFSGDLIDEGDFGYLEQRNDYGSVRNEFIDPLLESLGLDTDCFFICAGNHDIQRAKVDEFLEAGLEKKLVDRQSVNSLIDDFEDHRNVFARMTNFESFKVSINSKFMRRSNVLFSTYILDKPGRKIGIACLNSAWRAYGGKEDGGRERDYGKLLIGERAVDECLRDLEGCELRIGIVHHPFEYLREFERENLRRRIFGTFNIWLHGHRHEQDVALVQTCNNDRIVVIAGGALYRSREYYNGYSLIRYSLTEHTGKVYLREYTDKRRKFVEALAYADKGIASFTLSKDSLTPLNRNLFLISQIHDIVAQAFNEQLLPAIAEQSIAPRELEKVFVEPLLATKSEYEMSLERRRRDEIIKTLDEILKSERNILFIARKESGKTTLLNYICTRYLETDTFEQVRIPLLINHKRLPKGKDKIKKAIFNYIPNLELGPDLEDNLKQGDCIILVDDLDLRNRKALNSLVEFIKDHCLNRYIFAVNEDLLAEIEFDKPPDLGVEYDRVYIHSFRRKQIRGLVNKWFHEFLTDTKVEELSDMILSCLLEIRMPSTPLIISLLLLIMEQQPDYIPINKASLLENLIEMFLEKMKPLNRLEVNGLGGVDYRDKEHFLSHIAHYMVRKQNYRIDVDEFKRETRHYFESSGLTIPGGIRAFINYFIRRGILAQDSGQIYFRFKCFCEFFIAKYMIENKDFYEEVLGEDSYLAFANEIDYMTGLQRTNRDLVVLMDQRVRKSLQDFLGYIGLVEVDLKHFDDVRLNKSFLDLLSEKDSDNVVIERIRKSRLDEESRDELMDIAHKPSSQDDDQEIVRAIYEDYGVQLIANLVLFSNIIKNCAYLRKELRKESVNTCLQSFLELLYAFILWSEKSIDELEEEKVLEHLSMLETKLDLEIDKSAVKIEEIRENTKYFSKTFLFLFLGAVICESLGAPKLEVVLEEEIDNPDNPISLRLMYVMLYADLRLPGYIDKIKSTVKEIIKNRYYREIVFLKLLSYYSIGPLSSREQQRIENILLDIVAKEQGLRKGLKSQEIERLRALTDQSKFD